MIYTNKLEAGKFSSFAFGAMQPLYISLDIVPGFYFINLIHGAPFKKIETIKKT